MCPLSLQRSLAPPTLGPLSPSTRSPSAPPRPPPLAAPLPPWGWPPAPLGRGHGGLTCSSASCLPNCLPSAAEPRNSKGTKGSEGRAVSPSGTTLHSRCREPGGVISHCHNYRLKGLGALMTNTSHLRLPAPPQPRQHPGDSAGPPESALVGNLGVVCQLRGASTPTRSSGSRPRPKQPHRPVSRPWAYFLSDHFPFFLFYILVSSGEVRRFFYGLVQKLLTHFLSRRLAL